MWAKRKNNGFTIVELLIVIVVIAILAAITIVAFNGVQDRARTSAAASSSSQAGKKLKIWQVDNEATSPTCPKVYELVTGTTNGAPSIPTPPIICIFSHKDTEYQYTPSPVVAGAYCITASVATKSYKVSETNTPQAGSCRGHGMGGVPPITNLVTNPSVETNTANWQTPFGSGNNTNSRDTTRSYSGDASLKANRLAAFGDGRMARYSFIGQPTGNYVFSAWVYVNDAAIGNISLSVSGCGGTATAGATANTGGVIGQWRRVTSPYTVTAAGNICFDFVGGTSQIGSIFIDAAMVQNGSTLTNYADGSTDDWAWDGTANASSSTGPAQ